jgi:hypothetical protein
MAHRGIHRTQKWYHIVFWALVKFSIINAWIIHEKNSKKNLTQAEFIWNICLQVHRKKTPFTEKVRNLQK